MQISASQSDPDQPEDLSLHRTENLRLDQNYIYSSHSHHYAPHNYQDRLNNNNNKTDKKKKCRSFSHVKYPSWTQTQMYQAINCVIKQQLRFTQASVKYGIPKGTLYDNILGKSSRMKVLDEVGLTGEQEQEVLEFCCEISRMPYNRRTSTSLQAVGQFVIKLKHQAGQTDFSMSSKTMFQWWWAFTKKHNIISLYYQHE